MAASPPSTLQLGRPPRGASPAGGGPSWSPAGKLVSTFRPGLSLEKPSIHVWVHVRAFYCFCLPPWSQAGWRRALSLPFSSGIEGSLPLPRAWSRS